MNHITRAKDVIRALRGRWYGSYGMARCPSHDDRTPSLSLSDGNRGLLLKCFAGCDSRQVWLELKRMGLISSNITRAPLSAQPNTNRQLQKAQWLWKRRNPIKGSPAEEYLRSARNFNGILPATLGFLPPLKRWHHPALISAFGLADEPQVGALKISVVRGVHLTFLRADGSGKAETQPNKIMIGPSAGWPIVLAPPNDLLGLYICEGIETGLSLYEATGCGVWAAGSATRMLGLSDRIPPYIDCTTIAGERDEAGTKCTLALESRLRAMGMSCEVWFP